MTRILIVEDEKKIARFLELELEHEGYEVDTAEDGRTGLEKALSWKPDLMILDLMLPELSGIEVCRRLRHESDLPIIMLTAKDDVSDKQSARADAPAAPEKAPEAPAAPQPERSYYTSNPAAVNQPPMYDPAASVPTIQVPVQVESQDGSVHLDNEGDGYHSATIE